MPADPNTNVFGVVMAGGQGVRMQASGEQTPKPLVTVLGAPLVERNVTSLLRFGIADIRVVLAAGTRGAAIATWCVERGSALTRAAGGRLTVVEEPEPLGNCGGLAIAARANHGDAVLLFADNLTDLDLSAVVSTHRDRAAALTLAVHDEPFTLPYGVVDETDGAVSAYREKPTLAVSVSSGVVVSSPDARACLAGPAGLSDLANECVRAGLSVVTHPHSARWIDVNDADKISAAERMVRSAPERFEQFWPADLLDPAPRSDDGAVQLDDLDTHGQPVRLSAAAQTAEAVSAEAWRRIRAWQSTNAQTTLNYPESGDSQHRG